MKKLYYRFKYRFWKRAFNACVRKDVESKETVISYEKMNHYYWLSHEQDKGAK